MKLKLTSLEMKSKIIRMYFQLGLSEYNDPELLDFTGIINLVLNDADRLEEIIASFEHHYLSVKKKSWNLTGQLNHYLTQISLYIFFMVQFKSSELKYVLSSSTRYRFQYSKSDDRSKVEITEHHIDFIKVNVSAESVSIAECNRLIALLNQLEEVYRSKLEYCYLLSIGQEIKKTN